MEWGLSVKALVAECMATTLFVFIGCGAATTFSATRGFGAGFQIESATNRATNNTQVDIAQLSNSILTNPSWGIVTALAFGLAITVLAYATAHPSGGQMNPAVTFGLLLAGKLGPVQAVCNMGAQVAGALLGAVLLFATIPNSSASSLGANSLTEGVGWSNALCGEIVLTFVLVSVVLETASNRDPMVRSSAPLAIGFAVFCAHSVLLPIDGCSINPARSLGPAVVSGNWASGKFFVFVAGPFLGALLAVPFHYFYNSRWDTKRSDEALSADPLALAGGRERRDSTLGAGGAHDSFGGTPKVHQASPHPPDTPMHYMAGGGGPARQAV